MKERDIFQAYKLIKQASLGEYRPFNTNDMGSGMMYGAGAGALAGAGIQGLKQLFNKGNPEKTMLGNLLTGALYGGGIGALLPALSSLAGPAIGGQIGRNKVLSGSGIEKLENIMPTPNYRATYDSLAAHGKHFGEAATKDMTVADIARAFMERGVPQTPK
jgi:hypothetical protein